MWPWSQVILVVTLGFTFLATPVEGHTQGFNIDLDVFFGDPGMGNGAPSSSFGAASGQTGYWNRISMVAGGLMPIVPVDGILGSAAMNVEGVSGGGVGFMNPSNSGDFALLLNDAAQVGTVVQGGSVQYTFSGLDAGRYFIYTYAVMPHGWVSAVPVTVLEAMTNPTQVVTGPMPGNTFEYLVTHSIHEIDGNGFMIRIVQPPGIPNAMWINGFQIVPVPETNSAIVISVAGVYLLLRRRLC